MLEESERPIGAVATRPRRGRTCGGLACLLVVLSAMLATGCRKGATVEGRVLHGQTNKPVAGAEVHVKFRRYDANRNWVDGVQTTVTSDADGRFSADSPDMGARFVVTAKCDGFYPNYDCLPLRRIERRPTHMTHALEIVLMPVVNPRNLPRGQGDLRVSKTNRMGWSFGAGRMAPEGRSDIIGEADELGRQIAFLSARGSGGFRRATGLSGEWALFNMHAAPPDNYVRRVDLREVPDGERACYFVRTADGRHYAKIEVSTRVEARDYFGLRFYWVYQPDGSRELEIPLK